MALNLALFGQSDTLILNGPVTIEGPVTIIYSAPEKISPPIAPPIVPPADAPTTVLGTLDYYGYNVSTEVDSVMASGAFEVMQIDRLRVFNLLEKNLCGEGVYSRGGKAPKDSKFFKTPKVYKSVDWDCTFYPNKFRLENANKRVRELTKTDEVILNAQGDFRKWPAKDFEYWELGADNKEVYKTVYAMTYADLQATGYIPKYWEVRNESWHYTAEQWAVIEMALIDAWRDWNRDEGRGEDYANYVPKLGTNALPIGQGGNIPMPLLAIATSNAKYYTYVNVHVYPIDKYGFWSKDYSIVADQIQTAIEFQRTYFPNAHIRITETGAPNDARDYYTWLDSYVRQYPVIEAVFAYSLVKIPNQRFGECYVWKKGRWNNTGKLIEDLNNRRR